MACAAAVLAACGPRAEPSQDSRRQTIEGLTLSQSESGRPAWTLKSPQAELHEDAKTANLERPVMEFYRDGKSVSRVTALTGVVRTDTHDVRLSSSVVLDSFEDHSRMNTEELLYSSKRARFYTDASVVVRRPEGVIRGEGMDASPDLSEIRIYRQRSVLTGKPK